MHGPQFFSLTHPLDSLPSSGQMRTANFSGFAKVVKQRGADPLRLLERHNIDPSALGDPDQFVDCRSVVDLFEDSSVQLRDPLFGLHLAQAQDPEVFGCITALCRAAPNVEKALASFMNYVPVVHSPEAHIELVESEHTAELRWIAGSDLGLNHQANFEAALLNLKRLEVVAGSDFRASYVNLAVTPHDRDIPEVERQFGCRFNRTPRDNAIGFAKDVLNQPVATANRLVFELLGGYLDRVKTVSRKSVPDRVEDFVSFSLARGNCTIERCATKLGMSVRTLQTHLGDANLKFSDIVETQRFAQAKELLTQSPLTLDEISEKLGYTEPSSFGRAFKRWSGKTPRQFRDTACKSKIPEISAAFSMAFAKHSAGI